MADDLNDNLLAANAGQPGESYGHAAYLLVESLMHELIASAAITNDTAIEIVEIAAETGVAVNGENDGRPARATAEILRSLAASLRTDGHGPPLI